MSITLGVRELANNTSRIVRAVWKERIEYVITVRGEPVAVLRPLTDEDIQHSSQSEKEQALAEMKTLAQQVAAAWVSPRSGVELVNEQQR